MAGVHDYRNVFDLRVAIGLVSVLLVRSSYGKVGISLSIRASTPLLAFCPFSIYYVNMLRSMSGRVINNILIFFMSINPVIVIILYKISTTE